MHSREMFTQHPNKRTNNSVFTLLLVSILKKKLAVHIRLTILPSICYYGRGDCIYGPVVCLKRMPFVSTADCGLNSEARLLDDFGHYEIRRYSKCSLVSCFRERCRTNNILIGTRHTRLARTLLRQGLVGAMERDGFRQV